MTEPGTAASRLAAVAASRWRIAIGLTAAMIVLYFGFILLIAYAKPLLARRIVPGLSLGILLGALVILASWLLTWVYVRWANQHYDSALDRLRE
jgi:uncharacterized membrane protein (DUF485 family)